MRISREEALSYGDRLVTVIYKDSAQALNELAWRHRVATEATFAPIEGVDPKNLAETGWGRRHGPAGSLALSRLVPTAVTATVGTTSTTSIDDAVAGLKFDAAGLLPAVVQDHGDGTVLMVAWMDRDAVAAASVAGNSSRITCATCRSFRMRGRSITRPRRSVSSKSSHGVKARSHAHCGSELSRL